MGKSISTDMRHRMVRRMERGKSRRAVAAQYEVAPSTAVRLMSRYEKTGSVEPATQGRPRGSGKLSPHRDFILAQVEQKP